MTSINSNLWRTLAHRANIHLGAARMLIDEALAEPLSNDTANRLRSAQSETTAAQSLVREIAGGAA
jgi:hypothetical protein